MKKVFECRTLQFAKTSDNHVRASMSPILGYTYYPHENHCYVAKTRYMCDVTHIVLEEHEGARRERTLKTNSQVPLLLNTKLFEEQTLEEGEVAFPEKDLCLVRFTIRNDENAEFILASMSVLAFSIATSFETFSSPYHYQCNRRKGRRRCIQRTHLRLYDSRTEFRRRRRRRLRKLQLCILK